MQLTADPRLIEAAAGAVEHFAERSGFAAEARKDLAAAVEASCRDTFQLLTVPNGSIELFLGRYTDRVEVTISHRGEAIPTAGLDTFIQDVVQGADEGAATGLALLARVDRVQYQTEDGVSNMTLVKYLAGKQ